MIKDKRPERQTEFWYLLHFNSGANRIVQLDQPMPPDIYKASTLSIGMNQYNTRWIEFCEPVAPPEKAGGVIQPKKPSDIKRDKRRAEEADLRNPENTLSRVKETYRKEELGE